MELATRGAFVPPQVTGRALKGAADDSEGDDDEEEEARPAAAGSLRDPWMHAADIRTVLQGRVLPCLHSHLVEDEEVRPRGGEVKALFT